MLIVLVQPYTLDWDYNFPSGWKSADMAAATSRVFSRIPGTDHPSLDGKRYYQEGFEVLAGGLKSGGWTEVTANDVPNQKNHTYSHSPFMFSGGERGGPMATYLVSASNRKNFQLWMNTGVKRVIRTGGHVTGIEVEPFLNGGYTGTVNVTSITGRVILSAGTFGSAKILLRSELCIRSYDNCSNYPRWNWARGSVGRGPVIYGWPYHDFKQLLD